MIQFTVTVIRRTAVPHGRTKDRTAQLSVIVSFTHKERNKELVGHGLIPRAGQIFCWQDNAPDGGM